jgi:hypothetical protein
MTGRPDFGPFEPAFQTGELKVPGYLTLLGCGESSRVVFDHIARGVRDGDDPAPWVDVMLGDVNWRPHLVAAVVLLITDLRATATASLWNAIERGSWVTPQLVCTAFLGDYAFREYAIRRLDDSCPVNLPMGMSPAERHSATGPAGTQARRAKEAASLLAIMALVPDLESRAVEYQSRTEIQELLKIDAAYDNSSEIALSWLENVRERLAEKGLLLR